MHPPQTIAEKILSIKSGKMVYAGETVTAKVDAIMTNDASGPLSLDYLKRMKMFSVENASSMAFIIDHYVPCPDSKVAAMHQSLYEFAASCGIRFVSGGEGVAHQVFDELGYIRPGSLIIGGDSHTTSYGYLNCLAAGMGASDIAVAMNTGSLWFKVPETVLVKMTGKPDIGCSGKDIALYLLKKLGTGGADYCALEFTGEGMMYLSCDERWTICNMLAESGAKSVIMPFDSITEEHCESRGIDISFACAADAGCSYSRYLEMDLSEVGMQVATPHNPANAVPLGDLEGKPVDMALLGTCTNGRLSDFITAYDLMKYHDGKFKCEVILVPASRQISLELIRQGIAAEFIRRGAMMLPPACGPCCGSSPGVPRDNFTVISTANRNFIGRMGNVTAEIYLASPLVVTAAALTGKITNPGKIISGGACV